MIENIYCKEEDIDYLEIYNGGTINQGVRISVNGVAYECKKYKIVVQGDML